MEESYSNPTRRLRGARHILTRKAQESRPLSAMRQAPRFDYAPVLGTHLPTSPCGCSDLGELGAWGSHSALAHIHALSVPSSSPFLYSVEGDTFTQSPPSSPVATLSPLECQTKWWNEDSLQGYPTPSPCQALPTQQQSPSHRCRPQTQVARSHPHNHLNPAHTTPRPCLHSC